MQSISVLASAAPLRVLVLALFLVAVPSAHAADASEVRNYLISIRRLFEDLEYERALSQIQLAQRLPREPEEEVALALYEGIIQYELSRQEESTAAFKAALLLRPDAKLPVQVSPKLEQFFEAVRQKVKRERAPLLTQREAETPKAEPAPRPSPSLSPAPELVPEPVSTPSSTPASDTEPRQESVRSYALFPAIAGGVLVAAGGISWTLSRGELNKLRTGDSSLATATDVERTVSRGNTWQTVGVSLLSVGAASLATATSLYVFGAPDKPTALGVSVNGTSATIHGRWP
jgi:hypothetical protein